MKILVTGASGYIGHSFIHYFAKKYDFTTFSLLHDSLDDINFENIDTVLHCAALVHQKINHPYAKYLEVNTSYPVALAKKAKENGVKQFVFLSTIAVYGEIDGVIKENTACNPTTFYGRSKLEAEKLLHELNDDTFTVSVIRPTMVYGKNAPGNIDSLVKLVKKMPFLPFGKIKNERSFVYIGNLCYLIDTLMQQRQSGVFLASDDNPISTSRLIEQISNALGKKVCLMKIPLFGKVLKMIKPLLHKKLYGNLKVDNSDTKKVLGVQNIYTVEDGIEFMISSEDSLNV